MGGRRRGPAGVWRFAWILWVCLVLGTFGADMEDEILVTAPSPVGKAHARFGTTLCMDDRARLLAVGADVEDNYRGAVYVFDPKTTYLETGYNESWSALVADDARGMNSPTRGRATLRDRGSSFGFDCAMTGDGVGLAVSAPGQDLSRGAVYIFRNDQTTGHSYKQVEKIAVPQLRQGDRFGQRVAASTDGTVLLVTSVARAFGQGEAFVLRCTRHFEDCHLEATLQCPDHVNTRASNGMRVKASFGTSAALSADGSRAVIGATGFDRESGAAYVYEHGADGWTLTARLTSGEPREGGFFGYKVSMDASGQVIVVGADGENGYAGSAYVFRRQKDSYLEVEATLQLARPMAEDNFGGSVSLSRDGKVLVVGAPGVSIGRTVDAGRVYIYLHIGGEWVLHRSVEPPTPRGGAFFGWSTAVSANGEIFVISSPFEDTEAGSVYVGIHLDDSRRVPSPDSLAEDDVVEIAREEL